MHSFCNQAIQAFPLPLHTRHTPDETTLYTLSLQELSLLPSNKKTSLPIDVYFQISLYSSSTGCFFGRSARAFGPADISFHSDLGSADACLVIEVIDGEYDHCYGFCMIPFVRSQIPNGTFFTIFRGSGSVLPLFPDALVTDLLNGRLAVPYKANMSPFTGPVRAGPLTAAGWISVRLVTRRHADSVQAKVFTSILPRHVLLCSEDLSSSTIAGVGENLSLPETQTIRVSSVTIVKAHKSSVLAFHPKAVNISYSIRVSVHSGARMIETVEFPVNSGSFEVANVSYILPCTSASALIVELIGRTSVVSRDIARKSSGEIPIFCLGWALLTQEALASAREKPFSFGLRQGPGRSLSGMDVWNPGEGFPKTLLSLKVQRNKKANVEARPPTREQAAGYRPTMAGPDARPVENMVASVPAVDLRPETEAFDFSSPYQDVDYNISGQFQGVQEQSFNPVGPGILTPDEMSESSQSSDSVIPQTGVEPSVQTGPSNAADRAAYAVVSMNTKPAPQTQTPPKLRNYQVYDKTGPSLSVAHTPTDSISVGIEPKRLSNPDVSDVLVSSVTQEADQPHIVVSSESASPSENSLESDAEPHSTNMNNISQTHPTIRPLFSLLFAQGDASACVPHKAEHDIAEEVEDYSVEDLAEKPFRSMLEVDQLPVADQIASDSSTSVIPPAKIVFFSPPLEVHESTDKVDATAEGLITPLDQSFSSVISGEVDSKLYQTISRTVTPEVREEEIMLVTPIDLDTIPPALVCRTPEEVVQSDGLHNFHSENVTQVELVKSPLVSSRIDPDLATTFPDRPQEAELFSGTSTIHSPVQPQIEDPIDDVPFGSGVQESSLVVRALDDPLEASCDNLEDRKEASCQGEEVFVNPQNFEPEAISSHDGSNIFGKPSLSSLIRAKILKTSALTACDVKVEVIQWDIRGISHPYISVRARGSGGWQSLSTTGATFTNFASIRVFKAEVRIVNDTVSPSLQCGGVFPEIVGSGEYSVQVDRAVSGVPLGFLKFRLTVLPTAGGSDLFKLARLIARAPVTVSVATEDRTVHLSEKFKTLKQQQNVDRILMPLVAGMNNQVVYNFTNTSDQRDFLIESGSSELSFELTYFYAAYGELVSLKAFVFPTVESSEYQVSFSIRAQESKSEVRRVVLSSENVWYPVPDRVEKIVSTGIDGLVWADFAISGDSTNLRVFPSDRATIRGSENVKLSLRLASGSVSETLYVIGYNDRKCTDICECIKVCVVIGSPIALSARVGQRVKHFVPVSEGMRGTHVDVIPSPGVLCKAFMGKTGLELSCLVVDGTLETNTTVMLVNPESGKPEGLYHIVIKTRSAVVKEILRVKTGGMEAKRPVVFKNPFARPLRFIFTSNKPSEAAISGLSGVSVRFYKDGDPTGVVGLVPSLGVAIVEVDLIAGVKEFFLFVNADDEEEFSETRLLLTD